MLKRIISLVLVVVMALSLVACGNVSNKGTKLKGTYSNNTETYIFNGFDKGKYFTISVSGEIRWEEYFTYECREKDKAVFIKIYKSLEKGKVRDNKNRRLEYRINDNGEIIALWDSPNTYNFVSYDVANVEYTNENNINSSNVSVNNDEKNWIKTQKGIIGEWTDGSITYVFKSDGTVEFQYKMSDNEKGTWYIDDEKIYYVLDRNNDYQNKKSNIIKRYAKISEFSTEKLKIYDSDTNSSYGILPLRKK